MSYLFKTKEERAFAGKISEVVYCNPFTAERLRLESEALGSDLVEDELGWNLDPDSQRRHINIAALAKRIGPVLEAIRSHYLEGKGSAQERSHYADSVVFLLYIQSRMSFDHLIEMAHREGSSRRPVRFYDEFSEGFRYFFGTQDPPVDEAHLFAIFFQIRRAFYHIFKFFVGTSTAATQLRARLWRSIFTHDLHRYQRCLHDRMASIPSLITGPSGSGKEVVAKAIGFSQYVGFDVESRVFVADFTKGFYPVNLSALSPTLIESELFGHRKGAFTGAVEDREGYFSACGKEGVVFLDEIGEISLDIQVKLLRVLQTRQFQRLGDVKSMPFLGKVIAATNQNLPGEIEEGRFREDFYFRLRSDIIRTFPLKDSLEAGIDELSFLVDHAARQLVGEAEAPVLKQQFLAWQQQHPDYAWPGNFRELEQALRSILLHETYEPPAWSTSSADRDFMDQLVDSRWSLKELNSRYVTALYRKNPVYEDLARVLKVDRRTVKRYVEV